MIAIAPTNSYPLCAPSHSVPLYYLFRWQFVTLEKINTQLILGTKTAFRQRLLVTIIVTTASTRAFFMPLVEKVRMRWFVDWTCSIAPV